MVPAAEIVGPVWESYQADKTNQGLRNKLAEIYYPSMEYLVDSRFGTHPRWKDRIDDFRIEGGIALLECIERFQPSENNTFWTYAHRRVLGRCFDYLRQHSDLSRLRIVQSGIIRQAQEQHFAKHGVKATSEEIAAITDIPLAMVRFLRKWRNPISLNAKSSWLTGYEDHYDGKDITPESEVKCNFDDPCESLEIEEWVAFLCRGFNELEQMIIVENLYRETTTLKQIGEQFGISESRCSQVKKDLIKRIREKHEARRYDELPTCLIRGE